MSFVLLNNLSLARIEIDSISIYDIGPTNRISKTKRRYQRRKITVAGTSWLDFSTINNRAQTDDVEK